MGDVRPCRRFSVFARSLISYAWLTNADMAPRSVALLLRTSRRKLRDGGLRGSGLARAAWGTAVRRQSGARRGTRREQARACRLPELREPALASPRWWPRPPDGAPSGDARCHRRPCAWLRLYALRQMPTQRSSLMIRKRPAQRPGRPGLRRSRGEQTTRHRASPASCAVVCSMPPTSSPPGRHRRLILVPMTQAVEKSRPPGCAPEQPQQMKRWARLSRVAVPCPGTVASAGTTRSARSLTNRSRRRSPAACASARCCRHPPADGIVALAQVAASRSRQAGRGWANAVGGAIWRR